MKLHWSPKSPYVRKVMIAAHELGLADRIELVRSVAVMTRPNAALMADNPLSKIPALVLDSGEPIIDSLTICEMLDHLAGGGRLFPPPGPARWTALSRHALCNGLLDLLILWRNEREKPAERQLAEWLDAFALKTDATLARLEMLAPEFAQGPFGIAQIGLGCVLGYLDFRFAHLDWRRDHPGLAAWFAEFAARPSAILTEVANG